MSNAMQIGNNMHKAKYELLDDAFKQCKPTKYVNVFILVDSIMRSILKLSTETESMLPEKFVSEILATVGHYKRYFSKLWPTATVFSFLYFDSQKSGNIPNLRGHYAMKLVDDLAKTVINYIPNTYWIPCRYPIHAFPYSIISDIERDSMFRHYYGGQTALIVSDHAPDYYSLMMTSNVNSMAVFRRHRPGLFTVKNIWSDYLYQNRKYAHDYSSGRFDFLYPRILVSFPGKFLFKHNIKTEISNYYRDKLKEIFDANEVDSVNRIITEVENMEKDSFDHLEAIRTVDASYQWLNNGKLLEEEKLVWKHDRVDYDIDSLNTSIFKDFPVDFGSLI